MEHAEAVKLNAVEKYVLGELTASERDAFEEHYFDCVDCTADIKAAAIFIDNAREVLRRAPQAEAAQATWSQSRRGWFAWLQPSYAMGAIALLLLTIGYQNFVMIPRMKHDTGTVVAQALPTLSLTTSGSRGEGEIPEIAVPSKSAFGIYLDIPPGPSFASYSCEIRTVDGNTKFNIDVTSVQAKDTVELLVQSGTLADGRYEAVIFGNRAGHSSEEVARHPFAVRNAQ